ncbi:MAG: UDP-N-acetylglucosamine 2-epimerase, partial [Bacteroidetes bacterium]|nr:UDP-N-acetylglucosamine 2-epimerase [Bacteroidota bacterium]
NLRKAGIGEERIFFVGNTMIDTLLRNMHRFEKPAVWDEAKLTKGEYFVITLHRPANVDEEKKLTDLLKEIINGAGELPVIFPVHPRTARVLDSMGLTAKNLFFIEPLSYLEFNYLVKFAKAVVTDSGGITEETTVMGVPCMTLRNNTERPETCTVGTNQLIGTDPQHIGPAFKKLFAGEWQKGGIPELWDGKAAKRIVDVLSSI